MSRERPGRVRPGLGGRPLVDAELTLWGLLLPVLLPRPLQAAVNTLLHVTRSSWTSPSQPPPGQRDSPCMGVWEPGNRQRW